jgi:hypothetical protein
LNVELELISKIQLNNAPGFAPGFVKKGINQYKYLESDFPEMTIYQYKRKPVEIVLSPS